VNEELGWIRKAIEIIEDKKGEEIVVVDLSEVSIPTSYFVIASADNAVHLKAIASAFMKDFSSSPRRTMQFTSRQLPLRL
jgi:ribosomal silencing factor RsfS